MRPWSCFVVLAALGLLACNGPKDTCQGSVDSYWSLFKAHDWEGIYEMLTPEYKKKVGSAEQLASALDENWKGGKSYTMELDNVVATASGVCIANGNMNYIWRLRGENPKEFNNQYFSWTFHLLKDGKWYIDLPGEERLSGY